MPCPSLRPGSIPRKWSVRCGAAALVGVLRPWSGWWTGITTDLRDGGMGLCQTWWTFITHWVTLGQNEVRQAGPTDRQLSATQYRYLDAVRALGGTAGQRISRPRIHRPLADGLFDSESSKGALSYRPVDYR